MQKSWRRLQPLTLGHVSRGQDEAGTWPSSDSDSGITVESCHSPPSKITPDSGIGSDPPSWTLNPPPPGLLGPEGVTKRMEAGRGMIDTVTSRRGGGDGQESVRNALLQYERQRRASSDRMKATDTYTHSMDRESDRMNATDTYTHSMDRESERMKATDTYTRSMDRESERMNATDTYTRSMDRESERRNTTDTYTHSLCVDREGVDSSRHQLNSSPVYANMNMTRSSPLAPGRAHHRSENAPSLQGNAHHSAEHPPASLHGHAHLRGNPPTSLHNHAPSSSHGHAHHKNSPSSSRGHAHHHKNTPPSSHGHAHHHKNSPSSSRGHAPLEGHAHLMDAPSPPPERYYLEDCAEHPGAVERGVASDRGRGQGQMMDSLWQDADAAPLSLQDVQYLQDQLDLDALDLDPRDLDPRDLDPRDLDPRDLDPRDVLLGGGGDDGYVTDSRSNTTASLSSPLSSSLSSLTTDSSADSSRQQQPRGAGPVAGGGGGASSGRGQPVVSGGRLVVARRGMLVKRRDLPPVETSLTSVSLEERLRALTTIQEEDLLAASHGSVEARGGSTTHGSVDARGGSTAHGSVDARGGSATHSTATPSSRDAHSSSPVHSAETQNSPHPSNPSSVRPSGPSRSILRHRDTDRSAARQGAATTTTPSSSGSATTSMSRSADRQTVTEGVYSVITKRPNRVTAPVSQSRGGRLAEKDVSGVGHDGSLQRAVPVRVGPEGAVSLSIKPTDSGDRGDGEEGGGQVTAGDDQGVRFKAGGGGVKLNTSGQFEIDYSYYMKATPSESKDEVNTFCPISGHAPSGHAPTGHAHSSHAHSGHTHADSAPSHRQTAPRPQHLSLQDTGHAHSGHVTSEGGANSAPPHRRTLHPTQDTGGYPGQDSGYPPFYPGQEDDYPAQDCGYPDNTPGYPRPSNRDLLPHHHHHHQHDHHHHDHHHGSHFSQVDSDEFCGRGVPSSSGGVDGSLGSEPEHVYVNLQQMREGRWGHDDLDLDLDLVSSMPDLHLHHHGPATSSSQQRCRPSGGSDPSHPLYSEDSEVASISHTRRFTTPGHNGVGGSGGSGGGGGSSSGGGVGGSGGGGSSFPPPVSTVLSTQRDRNSCDVGSLYRQGELSAAFPFPSPLTQGSEGGVASGRLSLNLRDLPTIQEQLRATSHVLLSSGKRHQFASSSDIYRLFQGQQGAGHSLGRHAPHRHSGRGLVSPHGVTSLPSHSHGVSSPHSVQNITSLQSSHSVTSLPSHTHGVSSPHSVQNITSLHSSHSVTSLPTAHSVTAPHPVRGVSQRSSQGSPQGSSQRSSQGSPKHNGGSSLPAGSGGGRVSMDQSGKAISAGAFSRPPASQGPVRGDHHLFPPNSGSGVTRDHVTRDAYVSQRGSISSVSSGEREAAILRERLEWGQQFSTEFIQDMEGEKMSTLF